MTTNTNAAPDNCTILPDGSAFALAPYPLPKNHWLYAPREYEPGAEEPKELPHPILTHAHRAEVVAAVRYAIRGATMCGKEPDFDPDALVQNAVYALCGPFKKKQHFPPQHTRRNTPAASLLEIEMNDKTEQTVTDALPERDTTKTAEQQGLFRKFDVRRVDGSDQPGGKHHGCRYYVLDVDHDPYAAAALGAYADACRESHPELARDLREKWGAADTIDTLSAENEERLRGALEALADYVDERTGDNECRPLENARTTLAATKTGEQHDNLCT